MPLLVLSFVFMQLDTKILQILPYRSHDLEVKL